MRQPPAHVIAQILGFMLIVFVLYLFPSNANAALSVKVLSPMPNSAHVKGSDIVFEIEVTTGDHTLPFQFFWDFFYEPSDDTYDITTPQLFPPASFPAARPLRYLTSGCPGCAYLRVASPESFYSGETGREFPYRIKVQNGAEQTILYGTVFVADELQFSGWTWMGASTPVCVGGDTPGAACENDAACGVSGKCGNDAIGWTSFSCVNQNSVCGQFPTYLIKAKASDASKSSRLTGNAWIGTEDPVTVDASGNLGGYLTFEQGLCVNDGTACRQDSDCTGGASCSLTDNDAISQLPVGVDGEDWVGTSEYTRLYDSYVSTLTPKRYPGQLAGWGRFLGLRDYGEAPPYNQQDFGWVHLRGSSVDIASISGSDKFLECVDCTSGNEKCNICNALNVSPTQTPDIRNYSCNSCYNCDAGGTCDICEACSEYGISFDTQRAQLTGYAWAGGALQQGLGWMQFDPSGFGGVSLIQAWLATRFGDIYVGGNATVNTPLPAPLGSYNATYVIQANGTIEFIDFVSRAGLVQPSYPSVIGVPSPATQYINVLGRLDFAEMTKIGPNRYGETMQIPVGTGIDTYVNNALLGELNGKIYYSSGDAVIDESITINPGTATHPNGSGTIIIDGDLTITNNVKITYASGDVESLLALPSIVWLVRGDIIVDPSVGTAPILAETSPDLVGAYFALGRADGSGVPCDASVWPVGLSGDGQVCTGVTDQKELIVNGMMMAKNFSFQRTVLSGRGSEQILYDGRLIANPPPGLQNLSAALPVIREVTP